MNGKIKGGPGVASHQKLAENSAASDSKSPSWFPSCSVEECLWKEMRGSGVWHQLQKMWAIKIKVSRS